LRFDKTVAGVNFAGCINNRQRFCCVQLKLTWAGNWRW
jgi:hypothetical protein